MNDTPDRSEPLTPSLPALCLDFSHHPWTRGDQAQAVARTLDTAAAADETGIAAIWATEDPEGWDAFALLSALAMRTERAWLGTGVVNPYGRNPNTLAAALTTLDRLSAGRAILGLGRGQPEWHAGSLGVNGGSPLRQLEETIDLLDAWSQPPFTATSPAGGVFGIRDWERQLHATHRPRVLLAAAGPRALALAGRKSGGVIFNLLTSDSFLAAAIPAVRAAAMAAGRDPATLWFVLRTAVTVTDDPAPARERQKGLLATIHTLPGMNRLVQAPGFQVDELLTEIRERLHVEHVLAKGKGFMDLRRGDLAGAKALIPDALIDHLAIIGDVAHVRRRLTRLAELGVTHVGLAPPPDATSPDAWRSLMASLNP